MTAHLIFRNIIASIALYVTAAALAEVPQASKPSVPAAGSAKWESTRVNPKLIGFYAFTPDAPARKFRRRVVTGTMYLGFRDSTLPAGAAFEQFRDVWRHTEEFAQDDYAGSESKVEVNASVRYRGLSSSFPLESGGIIDRLPEPCLYDELTDAAANRSRLTASHLEFVGTGVDVRLAAGFGKALGAYNEELSAEDTEQDAIRRTKAQLELPPEKRAEEAVQTGAEHAAFFTKRTIGVGWTIQKTRYIGTFQVTGAGKSMFRVNYRVGDEEHHEMFAVLNSAPGSITVIIDATPQPYVGVFKDTIKPDYSIKVDRPDQQYNIDDVQLLEEPLRIMSPANIP